MRDWSVDVDVATERATTQTHGHSASDRDNHAQHTGSDRPVISVGCIPICEWAKPAQARA